MSITFYRLEPPFKLTPELPFRWSTIREGFAIEEDPGREQHSIAYSECLPLGRTQVKRRDREPVVDRETVEYFFGLLAESTILLGEEKDVHSSTMSFHSALYGYRR
jgi:hypothetical protein